MNYQGMQFYPSCTLHSREGAEFCFHLDASYEFYWQKIALVEKMENSGSNISFQVPLLHSYIAATLVLLGIPSAGLEITRTVDGAITRGNSLLCYPST